MNNFLIDDINEDIDYFDYNFDSTAFMNDVIKNEIEAENDNNLPARKKIKRVKKEYPRILLRDTRRNIPLMFINTFNSCDPMTITSFLYKFFRPGFHMVKTLILPIGPDQHMPVMLTLKGRRNTLNYFAALIQICPDQVFNLIADKFFIKEEPNGKSRVRFAFRTEGTKVVPHTPADIIQALASKQFPPSIMDDASFPSLPNTPSQDSDVISTITQPSVGSLKSSYPQPILECPEDPKPLNLETISLPDTDDDILSVHSSSSSDSSKSEDDSIIPFLPPVPTLIAKHGMSSIQVPQNNPFQNSEQLKTEGYFTFLLDANNMIYKVYFEQSW